MPSRFIENMGQKRCLELYLSIMCCFIKRTQKCTKLFFNCYLTMKLFFIVN